MIRSVIENAKKEGMSDTELDDMAIQSLQGKLKKLQKQMCDDIENGNIKNAESLFKSQEKILKQIKSYF